MPLMQWSDFQKSHHRPFMIFADIDGRPQKRFVLLNSLADAMAPRGAYLSGRRMKCNSLQNCSRLRWLGASGGLEQGHLFQLKNGVLPDSSDNHAPLLAIENKYLI
jgi:hypothetical protein